MKGEKGRALSTEFMVPAPSSRQVLSAATLVNGAQRGLPTLSQVHLLLSVSVGHAL